MHFRAPLFAAGLFCAATTAGAASSDPRTLIDAPLLPEGSAWNAPTAVVLENVGDPLVADLGRSVQFRALLLQADGNDVYWLEASEDGQAWIVVWRVPRTYGLPGLRTRTNTLSEQASARFLRVRATSGDGGFSVARLRVYPEPPDPWPPVLDRSLASASLPLFPMLTPDAINTLQGAAAVLGLLGAVFLATRPAAVRASRGLLGIAAVLSACAWINFGNFRYHDVVHVWEVYHYYVGAKYFPELGYDRLYACSAVAEAEDDGRQSLNDRRIRDLATNRVVSAESVLADPAACRSHFSEARWRSFRADVRVFRERLGASWREALLDHGFNATPVWTLAGGLFANAVPATPNGIAILVACDFALILGALGLVFAGFGFEAGCIAVIFFGVNAFSRYAWTGGAFLRYDWFFWAAAGVWALRRDRPVLAGFALTYTALLRIFPAALLAGVVLQGIGEAIRARGFTPLLRLRPVLLGAAIGLALLLPSAAAATGGLSVWRDFATNSRKYLATEADNRLGLATLAAYRHDRREALTLDPLRPDTYADWSASQTATLQQRRWLVLGVQCVFVLLLAWASAGHKPWVAAVLGAGLLPIAFRMANYYYGLLCLGATLAVINPAIGLGLASLAWASRLAADLWPAYDERAAALSALAVAFAFATPFLVSRSAGERGADS